MFHVEHFAVRVCFISRLPFWESGRDAAGRSQNGNEPGSDGIWAHVGRAFLLATLRRVG